MVSRIECSKCKQHFETKIDHLTEPIDVYSLWIDAAEAAAAEAANDPSQMHQSNHSRDSTARPASKHTSSRHQQQQQQQEEDADPFDDGINGDDGELPDNLF